MHILSKLKKCSYIHLLNAKLIIKNDTQTEINYEYTYMKIAMNSPEQ